MIGEIIGFMIWILLSVVGVVVESITAMVVYTTVIEKKYKKNEFV